MRCVGTLKLQIRADATDAGLRVHRRKTHSIAPHVDDGRQRTESLSSQPHLYGNTIDWI
jgi:hypothetical protein